MELTLYQIDAFASEVFKGNPAAVCPLEHWLDDAVMQAIAEENNLSETAFFVRTQNGFDLRWFTPVDEVDLCGHATLASAYVVFHILKYDRPAVDFFTRSGKLSVAQNDGLLTMDFPAKLLRACEKIPTLEKALGKAPAELLSDGDDYLAIFGSEREIRAIAPDMHTLKTLDCRGVIVSAKGDSADFVSRFFAPRLGVDEDPVTGSTHCVLTPYWAGRIGKNRLSAQQLSKRGGELVCELRGNRVSLSGRAVKYMEGQITL